MTTATRNAPAIRLSIPGYTDDPDQRARLIVLARRAHPGRDLQVVDVLHGDDTAPTKVVLDDRHPDEWMRLEPGVAPAAFADPHGAEKVDRWLRKHGRTLAKWDAAAQLAWSVAADTYDDVLRRRIAVANGLGNEPWRLRVTTSFESEPVKHLDRVEVRHASDVLPKYDGAGWSDLLDFEGRWEHTYNRNRRLVTFQWRDPRDPLKAVFTLDATAADQIDPTRVPPVVLGKAESGELLTLDLARDATHIALQGQTRSGKSVFTYNLLATLAASRAVDMFGVDPSGILLAPFAGTRHESRVAVGTQAPDKYVKVLEEAVATMDARTAELGRTLTADKLEDFSPEQPLLLVVLEEMPGIMKALRSADASAERGSPKLEAAFKLLMSRLLAEGAKVGVRCVLIAQRFDTASAIDGSDRANIGLSITFRVKRADAIAMLHEELPEGMTAQQVGLFAPGVGLIESPVIGQDITRFRAPFIEGGFAAYARRVREHNPPLTDAVPVDAMQLPEEEVVDLGTVALEWDEGAFAAPTADGVEDLAFDLDEIHMPAAHKGTTDEEELTW